MDAMKLPAHLDYVEVNVPDEEHSNRTAYPEVFCTVPGCLWRCDTATWDDLADDGYIDWNAEHPAHA